MSWHSRFLSAFRPARVDEDLAEEMEFHIERRREELIAAGVTPAEAERAVHRQFGSSLRIREQSRAFKLLPRLESILQDTRFALRLLWKSPAFSLTAIAALGLAIGANAAAFALLDVILLRPLPVRDPGSLVYMTFPMVNGQGKPEVTDSFSYPLFKQLRDTARGSADLLLVGYQFERPAIIDGAAGRDEKVMAQAMSGDVFSQFGLQPAVGRLFAPSDDQKTSQPVCVVSHAFWQRRFGSDPQLERHSIRIDQFTYQIVGVTREGFTGTEPGFASEVWIPSVFWNPKSLEQPGWSWFRIWGRLIPGTSREALHAKLQSVFSDFRRERAKLFPPETIPGGVEAFINTPLSVEPAGSGPSMLRRGFERPLWILTAVVGFVLLIACAVLANLMLARASSRQREIALRISIGAGRGRLLQQMLVECGLLAVAASAFGAFLAMQAVRVVVGMMGSAQDPLVLTIGLDARVVAALSGLAMLSTALFGILPSWRASRTPPSEALKSGGGKHTRHAGLSRLLVGAQVGFCFLLLFVAGLLLRTFNNLTRVDLGFQPHNLMLMEFEARAIAKQPQEGLASWTEMRRRAAAVPGVTSVALSMFGFFSGNGWTDNVRLPGGPLSQDEMHFLSVTPGFFATMGMRMFSGRDFTESETQVDPARVAVVNAKFARRFFENRSPLGQTIEVPDTKKVARYEIVGVVEDAHYRSVRDPAPPTVYVPQGGGAWQTLLVRTSGDPLALAPTVRKEVAAISQDFSLRSLNLQSRYVDDNMLQERLLATLSSFFSTIAVVLAAIGLYGVLNYLVVQQRKEIGIRLALGASRLKMIRFVVAGAIWVTLAGVASGLAGGLLVARYLQSVLYGVHPWDPASIALPAGTLLLAAIVAAFPPVWRAVRVDPIDTLRYE